MTTEAYKQHTIHNNTQNTTIHKDTAEQYNNLQPTTTTEVCKKHTRHSQDTTTHKTQQQNNTITTYKLQMRVGYYVSITIIRQQSLE